MSKSQLEKVLEHLINDDAATAEALLHEFIVAQAKKVHRDLMVEAEGIEEESLSEESEEYYDAGELEGEEGDEEAEAGEAGEEGSEDEEGGEEAAADLSGEMGGEVDGGEESAEDRIDDLEAKLEKLQAEFDSLMAAEEDEHGEDLNGDGEIAGAEGGEGDVSEPLNPVSTEDGEGLEGDEMEESFMFDEEFADLEESFELEPVKVEIRDGKEIGAGAPNVFQNVTSPIPQKKVGDRAFQGKAIEVKSTQHKGYAKEASPSVKELPLRKNQVKHAQDNLEGVSKEGDKSALLNKKDGFGAENNKSPIGSSGARTGAE